MNDGRFRHAVFDEHAFLGGDGQEELMEGHFVGGDQGAQGAFETVLEFDVLGILFEIQFHGHKMIGFPGREAGVQ
jgi:hypothetical protein